MTDMISMLDCRYKLGATRLAAAALSNAIAEREDDWFKDTQSDHPFSLRWCCVAISLGIGDTLDPEAISKKYFDGTTDNYVMRRFDAPGVSQRKMESAEDKLEAHRRYNKKYRMRRKK
jgi:hypothetical protein